MFKKNLIDEIENIFITELGEGSSFILHQNIRELGLTPETLKKSDVNNLISNVLREYELVLGNHINILKAEVKKRVV